MTHQLPEGDVLIHAGDLENSGTDIEDVIDYAYWLQGHSFKYKKIIQIAGNHDGSFQNKPYVAKEILLSKVDNLVYLENSSFEFEGIKFWGSPYTPEFMRWYFMYPRGKKAKEIWSQIPDDIEVLITHGPPYGIKDFSHYDKIHVGCESLLQRVEELKKLKLHVFGHLHECYGVDNTRGYEKGPCFVNASICNLKYKPINEPVVINLQ